MRRLVFSLLVLVVALSLMGSAEATTQYDVDIDNGSAVIDVSFELYSEGEGGTNYWRTEWTVPADSRVVYVRDSLGRITDYERNGQTLLIETNDGARRQREVVDIRLRVPDVVQRRYGELKVVRLNLPGFKDRRSDVPEEVTQARITTDERVLSESHGFGTSYEIGNHSLMYRGSGGLSVYFAMSDGGRDYDNYVLYGDADLEDADELYSVIPAVTGHRLRTNKLPVVVLPDGRYDEVLSPASEGEYMTGGVIFVRKSVFSDGRGTETVLHEATHAHNEKALMWSPGVEWFNEGVAKYVEFLAAHELGVRRAEIFGEPVRWSEECTRNGRRGTCTYTIQPRQTASDLREYYSGSRSGSMHTWRVEGEHEGFGYAFSELVIRNYVLRNGADALHPVYDELHAVEEPVSGDREASLEVLSIMGTDLTPCRRDSIEGMRECLDRVNAMDAEIPGSPEFDVEQSDQVEFTEIEEPSPPKSDGGLLGWLGDLIARLTQALPHSSSGALAF